MRIVSKDVIFGAFIQGGQSIYAGKDVIDLLDEIPRVATTAEALETVAQGIGDGVGQGFTGFLGNLARKLFGFGVFDA